ncbi:hypothetical protein K450DRAFT_253791 [Umbelopsis ramanniana AG]|uniref:Mid2 domain-containing protein n=1 Tax=Umbelopsis ramanniana AG TaxID=1314678 RepID=A0AAD5E5K5_UMBRA|nr:uncharacterized protein K450DRAFT_253791 [Umbelopsis ramanniana AG]KAI8577137.1 hypothetical protein K450DRAFT_253791 [Umbelopsis ramanniana AG]
MRLTCASLCLIGLFVQKATSVSLSYPFNGGTITAGISFQIDWQPDGLPSLSGDGSMDILLVTDISASKVVAVLDSNVSPSGLFTSATVPLTVTNGAYYIQLKVTSGNEKTAVNGPFIITGGSQSSSSSSANSSQTSNADASNSQSSSTATHTVTNASATYNSPESSSLSKGAIAGIAVISVVVMVAAIGGTIFWWRKKNRLVDAITTKFENEAKFYDRQAQMNDVQPTSGGTPSPTSPQATSYNASFQNTNALSTEPYNYVAGPNYAVDQQSQIPLQSPPAYYPSAHIHNSATAYPIPMPMPVPFVRQQEEPHHQQSIYDAYVSNAGNPAMTDSSRMEVSTISSAPNTNDTSSLLNSAVQQSSIRHVPHTPDEVVTSPPHLNDAQHPPHTA